MGWADKWKMCILIIDRATLVDRCRFTGGKGKKRYYSMLSFRIFPNEFLIFRFLVELVNIRIHLITRFLEKKDLKNVTCFGTKRKIKNGKFKSTERYS